MMVSVAVEIMLNRGWIYDDEGNEIGETNFVVTNKYLQGIFKECYADNYPSISDFLLTYTPEIEGQEIYSRALADGEVIEDF